MSLEIDWSKVLDTDALLEFFGDPWGELEKAWEHVSGLMEYEEFDPNFAIQGSSVLTGLGTAIAFVKPVLPILNKAAFFMEVLSKNKAFNQAVDKAREYAKLGDDKEPIKEPIKVRATGLLAFIQ